MTHDASLSKSKIDNNHNEKVFSDHWKNAIKKVKYETKKNYDLKFSPFLADQNMITNRAALLRPSVTKRNNEMSNSKDSEILPFSDNYRSNFEQFHSIKHRNKNSTKCVKPTEPLLLLQGVNKN